MAEKSAWTGYGLDDKSQWGQEFSLLHVVLIGSGAHPASYPMGTEGSFPKVKRPGRGTDHSPPASAEFKKTWVYTFTFLYVFRA
jgi:hypothetical protein